MTSDERIAMLTRHRERWHDIALDRATRLAVADAFLRMKTEREERREDALLRIQQWAKAYPTKMFTPLSIEDLRHCQFALKAIGIDMGAMHAEWARHILKGIAEITEEALDG